MYNKEYLINCLKAEGGPISEDILMGLIERGKYIKFNPKDYIIKPGKVEKNLWITASGVFKTFYFDGKKEKVVGFGSIGTIFLSPIGFLFDKPAFSGFQAITECGMIRFDRKTIYDYMGESHSFSKWLFGVALTQISVFEMKTSLNSERDIISNYKSLINRQMQIGIGGMDSERINLLRIVSSKDIASYLGITQSYLSNIRKMIIEEERAKKIKDNH